MIDKLLERDAPLAQLHVLLSEVSDGNGASIIVTGEAGAGKTTFFQTFETSVRADARVFRGFCEDLSIPEPLGPIRELARSAGWDVDLEQLIDGQRLETFAELLELANDSEQPTILIIEDLHWADEASLDFVRFVARRIASTRIMLLINSRNLDDVARHKLRAAFNGAPAESQTRIELQPLSAAAVNELAGQTGLDGAKVFQQSAGNAFYVTEILRNRDHNMPSSVQDAVLIRVDSLSSDAQEILSIVSIFPRRAELDLVVALCEGDGFKDIEACIAEGLLIDSGEYLGFRHEIARLAVENEISTFKKRALNTALYNLLASAPKTPKARLMHHARGGSLSDAVRQLAPAAAREAEAAGAFSQSAEYYEIALEFRKALPIQQQAELLESAARVFALVARQPTAIANFEEALAIRKSLDDKLACANNLQKLARLHWETGLKQQAMTLANEAIKMAEGTDGYELAWSYAVRGQIAMTAFRFELAADASRKAIEIAKRHGFEDVESFALSSLGLCDWVNIESSISILKRGLELGLKQKFQENIGRGYTNVAIFMAAHYLYNEAVEVYDEGIQYCNETDLRAGAELLQAWRFDVREQMGAWDEVYTGAETLLSEDLQHSSAIFFAKICMARIAMRRGLPVADNLFRQLEHAIEKGEDARHISNFATLLAEKAYLGLASQEPALELMARVQAMPVDQVDVEQFYLWQKRLGITPEYQEHEILQDVYRIGLTGDWQGEAAVWAKIGSPYQEALALLNGDVAAKTRALEILDRLGATVVSEVARRKMRDDGVTIRATGPRASTKTNPAGLTKRQLDVLRLLNEGLSNAEIGEKLFVSAKTVDHHVSAILGKLEVSSRGEAAAYARDAGWV